MKSQLLTLGSAAVVAVYAVGFHRTRAAAERFNDLADLRRSAAPAPPLAAPSRDSMHAYPADSTDQGVIRADTAVGRAAPSPRPATATKRVAARTPRTVTQVDSELPPLPGKSAVIPPLDSTPPAGSDSAPQPADKAPPQWKDGTYLGWGTSRHGDIEASVEIKDGRIVSAAISQCLTRYSCSWISRLPPQVVARQGANVDYVSGATQSSDAFYQAVTEALSKAK